MVINGKTADRVPEIVATFADLVLSLERGDLERAAACQRRLAVLDWSCKPIRFDTNAKTPGVTP